MSKNSAIRSGEKGEKIVSELLGSAFETHYLINNLILLGDNGVSHQIDHVYLSERGVFVIETKNYYGEIKGHEDDAYWTRTYLARSKMVTTSLPNPLKQNKSHLKAVKRVIGRDIPLYGFIVLVQNNEQNIDLFNVTNPTNLLQRMHLLISESPLSIEKLASLHQLLLDKEADVSDLTHVENIIAAKISRQENQSKLRKAIETRICPYCQGALKLNKVTLVCAICHKEIKL